MNEIIANIIKSQIEGLAFIDRIAGLVKVVRRQDVSEKGTIVKVFPVDCGVTEKDCVNSKYTDLVPNSKCKSIHYFEDLGSTLTGQENGRFNFESKIKLVGWLNLKKLGKTDCSVSHLAIAAILKQITSKYFSSPSNKMSLIQIRCTGIDPKSAAIFSKYSYSEEINQYLLFPFDYYAMTFTVVFSVANSCIDEWVASTETNCVNNGS